MMHRSKDQYPQDFRNTTAGPGCVDLQPRMLVTVKIEIDPDSVGLIRKVTQGGGTLPGTRVASRDFCFDIGHVLFLIYSNTYFLNHSIDLLKN